MTRPVIGELTFTGINRDKVPGDVGADWWTDGRNIIFIANETRRAPGEGKYGSIAFLIPDIRRIHYVDTGVQSWWIYCGDAGVAVTNGTSSYNITPVGWTPIASKNKVFSIGDLNGLPFVNHPEVGPFWWDGVPANVMKKLPDWPASWTARVMRAHKYFLLAGCIDTGAGLLEGQVSWSSSADPGTVPTYWVPTATNDAGDAQFSHPSGEVVDMLSVRDQLFIAKNNYTGVMQYVGGQMVFETRDVFPSMGIFAPDCWVEANNLVYQFTGSAELVRHDATSVSNLLLGVLQDYVRGQINYEYPSSVFLFRDDDNGQVVLAYPVGTGKACTEGISVEIQSLRPGIRDLPGIYDADYGVTTITLEDWDHDAQIWDNDLTTWNESASGYQPAKVVFAAGTNGMVEQGKTGQQIDPATGLLRDMQAYVRRDGIDIDEMDFRKTFSGCRPRIKGAIGQVVKFQFGAQASDSQPIELVPEADFRVGQDDQVDFFCDGRLLTCQARSTTGTPWALSSLFPLVKKSGRW